MKVNVSYAMEVSEEDFYGMKKEVGVDTDEEFIGFLKCVIKAQSTARCKLVNLKIEVEHDAPFTPSNLN